MSALASVAGLSFGMAGLAAAGPATAASADTLTADTVTFFNVDGAPIGEQVLTGLGGATGQCFKLMLPDGTASLQVAVVVGRYTNVYPTSDSCQDSFTSVPDATVSGMISDTSGLGSVYAS